VHQHYTLQFFWFIVPLIVFSLRIAKKLRSFNALINKLTKTQTAAYLRPRCIVGL